MPSALLIKIRAPLWKADFTLSVYNLNSTEIEMQASNFFYAFYFKLFHCLSGLHAVLSSTSCCIRGSFVQATLTCYGKHWIHPWHVFILKKKKREKDGILTVQLVYLLLGKQTAKRKKPLVSLSFGAFSGEAELVLKQWKHCSAFGILCCPRWMTDTSFSPLSILPSLNRRVASIFTIGLLAIFLFLM